MKTIKIVIPETKETVNALVVFELEDNVKLIYAQNRVCLYRCEEILPGIHRAELSVVIEYAKNEEFDKILEKADAEDNAKNDTKDLDSEDFSKNLIEAMIEILSTHEK